MQTYLDFEKGLAEIEGKAEELRTLARKNTEMNVEDEAPFEVEIGLHPPLSGPGRSY